MSSAVRNMYTTSLLDNLISATVRQDPSPECGSCLVPPINPRKKVRYMSTTGQKPGKGVYTCTRCGEVVRLPQDHDTLPPCPKCHGTNFRP
ncbi:zinc ribbon-containing protein [Alicyclobacillus fastidiosus]|uniref:zinc ribbon-containing protein n=1 Tax=Alicyclobacillus fastidiosus TaxID=392011 RepID=UPI0035C90534